MPPLDLEMEPGEGLNGIPGWSVGVLEGITMSYQVKKVILPTYNLHTAFPPSAHFVSKSGISSDPLVLGKNDFVGSNEHIPWVSYIKLHLKMSGVNQLQISPPPNLRMNLACQKCLGNLPKVLGIGVTPPPPFGKNSQKIPFFLNESPP